MMWSAKEAVLKATGFGLSLDPRNFEIQFPYDEPSSWELTLDGVHWKGSYEHIRHQNKSYALSWCVSNRTSYVPLMKEITLFNK